MCLTVYELGKSTQVNMKCFRKILLRKLLYFACKRLRLFLIPGKCKDLDIVRFLLMREMEHKNILIIEKQRPYLFHLLS